MAMSPLRSPVALDGIVSLERLREILALGTEYAEVDFKARIDPGSTESLVELACDVGAMQVRGGYIVVGVDNGGRPVNGLDGIDVKLFDESRLRPKLLKYLPEPLTLATAVHEVEGHTVVLTFVGPHPSGCAFFTRDGQYSGGTKPVVKFRKGDVYWRNGTSSERLSQLGFEEIVEGRVAGAKVVWLGEEQEVRRHQRAEAQAASQARRLAVDEAIGTVNFDLPLRDLTLATLELIRANDDVALRYLFDDVIERARSTIERGEIETELGDILDKLTCLAATFLKYQQNDWFDRVVATFVQIYSLPLRDADHATQYGLRTHIDPNEVPPRVWLQVIARVFALGALAVRRRDWAAVRTLTLQLPEHIDYGYDTNWLRHALTMSSRAQFLDRMEGDQVISTSLLALAREHIERLECLQSVALADSETAFKHSRSSTCSRTSLRLATPAAPSPRSSTRTSRDSGSLELIQSCGSFSQRPCDAGEALPV